MRKVLDLIYTKDIKGQDVIIDPNFNNYQVMMEWEKPYMKALVDNLKPNGDVLEIGFGLGYSAEQIQKYKIKSHTIIEPNNSVIKKLNKWAKKQKHKVIVVEGIWQEQLKHLGKFNSIFFDDSPANDRPDYDKVRVYDFYYQIFENHIKPNAKFTWFCDEPISWICHPETTFTIKKYRLKSPDHCNYTKTNVMYMPLVKFPSFGILKGINKLALTYDCKLIKFLDK